MMLLLAFQHLAMLWGPPVVASVLVIGESVECDSVSTGTFTYGNSCYSTGGYATGSDSCRAAQQGLKDRMVGPTGVTCLNSYCTPASCHTAVQCLDPTCSHLTVYPAVQDPETGLYSCTACWSEGEYKVLCTHCVPN